MQKVAYDCATNIGPTKELNSAEKTDLINECNKSMNVDIITNKNKCKRYFNIITLTLFLCIIIVAGRSIQDFIFCKLPNSKNEIILYSNNRRCCKKNLII